MEARRTTTANPDTEERGAHSMTQHSLNSQVPSNWFVDPVHLGLPGVRRTEDDEQLSWQTDALCAQTDPEAFFPEKGGSTREAKRICDGCEVRSECLDYALANDERFGIWGGLSERERRKLRRDAV
jgi:WhiB family redox-sensing transcriptional regulator